jgi:hypothetical protein
MKLINIKNIFVAVTLFGSVQSFAITPAQAQARAAARGQYQKVMSNQAAVRAGAQGGVYNERQGCLNGTISCAEAKGAVQNYRRNAAKGVVSRYPQ